MRCPCHTKQLYSTCCERFHKGQIPSNALLLMRSRYAAYALGLTDYIINTSLSENSSTKEEIKTFCDQTFFEDLHILEFRENEESATVTFKAILSQNSRDISFKE
jgi:SEC-C motif-containing protein